MSRDWNDLDSMMRSRLADVPQGEPVFAWNEMSPKVKFSNFSKFKLTSFNLYYAAAAVAAMSVCGVYTYHAFATQSPQKTQHSVVVTDTITTKTIQADTVAHTDTTTKNTVTAKQHTTIQPIKREHITTLEEAAKDDSIDTVRVIVKRKIIKRQTITVQRNNDSTVIE